MASIRSSRIDASGLRRLRNLTQEQLGEKAQICGKFVGQVERGSGNPSLDVLIRLAAALAVELWELLRFEESRPHGSAARAAQGLAAAERVAGYLSGRPARDLERALRILEAALDDLTVDKDAV